MLSSILVVRTSGAGELCARESSLAESTHSRVAKQCVSNPPLPVYETLGVL